MGDAEKTVPGGPAEDREPLRREIERLRQENERLRNEKEVAEERAKKIEEEFRQYKLPHPETVGVKNGKPYTLKTPAKGDDAPKGPPGARRGHKPAFRKTPEREEEEVLLPMAACPCCGGTNLSEVQETRSRPVEDIELGRVKVTGYRTERKYCRDCKRVVEPRVAAALPGARIGLRTMLLIVYLKVGLRLPVEASRPS